MANQPRVLELLAPFLIGVCAWIIPFCLFLWVENHPPVTKSYAASCVLSVSPKIAIAIIVSAGTICAWWLTGIASAVLFFFGFCSVPLFGVSILIIHDQIRSSCKVHKVRKEAYALILKEVQERFPDFKKNKAVRQSVYGELKVLRYIASDDPALSAPIIDSVRKNIMYILDEASA